MSVRLAPFRRPAVPALAGGALACLLALALAVPLEARQGAGPGSSDAPGTSAITAAQVEAVDEIFSSWADPAGPGAAVAVTRNGRTIYSQGYGSAQLEYRIPVTPSTPFHVASVSKQFTAFAVALLARDGVLSWDDPVHAHLPELPEMGHPVTLRQLAEHTSGVRDQWELLIQAGWRIDDVITRDQIMGLMMRQQGLNFEPGSEHLYSNMGYTLLAEVVERASGEDFGDFLRERVFLPLGMHRTHVHSDHTHIVPGRAYSYAPAGGGGWRNAVLSYANQGATSLFTTVEDLARWLVEMESPQVGDAALWAEMTEPARLNGGDTVPYGLGLSVGIHRGLRTQGHGGADAGFRTNLQFYPDESLGVVVFGNASSFNAAGLARAVAEVFVEDRMEPVTANVESSSEEAGPVELSAEALEALVGVYRPSPTELIRVRVEVRGLVVEAGDGPSLALLPFSRSTFRVEGGEGRVTFSRDSEDRVDAIVVSLPGGTVRGRRVSVASLPAEELAGYSGSYYSPELDVVYRIRVEEETLVAERPRQPDQLLLLLDRDRFASSQWGLNAVDFVRDDTGVVEGMRISGGRVRNIHFHRVEPWEP